MEEKRDARGLTEAEAIARYKSRNYTKPALTADIVVLSAKNNKIKVLLVERGGHPFIGKLALPGGFAAENEAVEETAARELKEETGVDNLQMTLVGVFSKPGRDPRGWVVSAAFAAIIDDNDVSVCAGDDAANADWYDVTADEASIKLNRENKSVDIDDLAFDHGEILRSAFKALNISL